MTVDGERFDQGMYDAVMARVMELTLSPGTYHVAQVTAEFAARIAAERAPVAVYEGSLDDVVSQVRADFEQLILAHNAGEDGTAGHWVDSIIRTIVVKVAQSVISAQDAPPSH